MTPLIECATCGWVDEELTQFICQSLQLHEFCWDPGCPCLCHNIPKTLGEIEEYLNE